MKCPHCEYVFPVIAINAVPTPVMPILCGKCLKISMADHGKVRTVSDVELENIKESPAYKQFIRPARHHFLVEHSMRNN